MSNGHGGKREGSGRPPDWLKAKCQDLIDKNKVLEFLASVANGDDVEQAVGAEGEVIRVPAAVRDRIKASEVLLERGFGKVPQALEHSGEINGSSRLIFVFEPPTDGNSDSK